MTEGARNLHGFAAAHGQANLQAAIASTISRDFAAGQTAEQNKNLKGFLGDHSLLASADIEGTPTAPGPVGSHQLQDYQTQLMLLEQQNKKRLFMAREEQVATLIQEGQARRTEQIETSRKRPRMDPSANEGRVDNGSVERNKKDPSRRRGKNGTRGQVIASPSIHLNDVKTRGSIPSTLSDADIETEVRYLIDV